MTTDSENTENNFEEQEVIDDAAQDQSLDAKESQEDIPETDEQRLERERAEYLEGWQRSQAEVKNLMKRHEEERKTFTVLGKEALLQELIPMMDNFDAAMSNTAVWESVDVNWRMGIEYIHSQFVDTLANNGVQAFGSVSDTFDATLHEPVASEGEGQVVVKVLQKGYRIGERIVRPAKVELGD